jgi:hypothetical protein
MSWFNASQLSSFAKQALSQAQKSIDRVLDIQEEEPGAWADTIPYGEPGKEGLPAAPQAGHGRRTGPPRPEGRCSCLNGTPSPNPRVPELGCR